MNKLRTTKGNIKKLLKASGYKSIVSIQKENPTFSRKEIDEWLLENYNNIADYLNELEKEKEFLLYKNEVIIKEHYTYEGIDWKINAIELNKMKKKLKNKPALLQQKIEFYDNKGKKIDSMLFETDKITKEFINKINMFMTEGVTDGTWKPNELLNRYQNGYTKIITRALKPIESKKRPQIYKDNNEGTCVYDGVVKYFETAMEKNKNAKAIYNKLISNKETLAKPYTDESIENELAPFCNSSITIKNLINGKDKKLNENTFNRFNIEFLNTKYNHLDLLAHNYNEVEEVTKEQMKQLKHDLPFYINKCGSLITLNKTYKQKDTDFQIAYKEWKNIMKNLYNINYDMLFIYQDTDEYKMLQRYDYKLHTFFNDFDINNSLYKEADLKKAYYNYSNKEFNRFYRGVPSGSFLNFTCTAEFDFETITENGLIGFYEIKIIDSELDERLGFTNGSIHYLFTSMIELLLENDVEIEFLNASYSPSVHIPFTEKMKETDNPLDKKKGLKHYCKAFGLMLASNSIIDISIKPLKCDNKYFDTINDEGLTMYKDENIIKLQYTNKKPKSYIHIGYALHAYTQTLILEQLINMDLDYVFGVKLDSIVYKKEYEYDFGNNFDEKKCKVEGLLTSKIKKEEYVIDGVTYIIGDDDEEEWLEEDEQSNSGFYRKYIVSSYTKNLNFKDPFTQTGEYIINRIVFMGGAGGTGKTYSFLNYLPLNTACYSTMCWNLIQGKIEEYKGLNGHSIPQLTGGTENFKCEKTTDKNIKYIILDEATLLNKLDIIHIIANYPSCFIFILGDVDYDGFYYQASVSKQVFNPSEDTYFIEEVEYKNGDPKAIITYDFDLQYIKYTKTFRFDENLSNKLNVLRDVMKTEKKISKYYHINKIVECVKSLFPNNFKNIEDVIFNNNDVGICARDDLKRGNELTNYFIEKGTKPKYFIKKTIKEKNQLKGQELLEIPEHNNYECKLFKTIHSFQGLDLSHDNKIVIIIDSLFDENLLYTALSRARREDQIILVF